MNLGKTVKALKLWVVVYVQTDAVKCTSALARHQRGPSRTSAQKSTQSESLLVLEITTACFKRARRNHTHANEATALSSSRWSVPNFLGLLPFPVSALALSFLPLKVPDPPRPPPTVLSSHTATALVAVLAPVLALLPLIPSLVRPSPPQSPETSFCISYYC